MNGRASTTFLGPIFAMLLGSLLFDGSAEAQIYHYVDRDGAHHFTTYRQSGMTLLEVFGGSNRTAEQRRTRTTAPSQGARGAASYSANSFDDQIREAASAYEIPFEFIKAVIRAESAFNPRAVSRAGAMGLMQLMPGTAGDMGVSDSFDPRQNILGGTRYLRILSDRYNGDINLVLSAYNAGPGRVAEHNGIPFNDTRRYIRTVYRYYQEYLDQAR